MTAPARPEDAPPCLAPTRATGVSADRYSLPVEAPGRQLGPPRVLRFTGGNVSTEGMPEAHPGGVTPTTYVDPSPQARGIACLELARINIAEALDTGSAFDRKFSIQAAKTCIDHALELLK